MIDRPTLYASPADWAAEADREKALGANVQVVTWYADTPGDFADLLARGWPLLYVRVGTPRNQTTLHRILARLGYTADLLAEDAGHDYWRMSHPDGARPSVT